MATSLYIHHRGQLRIYDGGSPPNYLVIPWLQPDAVFPLNRPRPEPVLRLNRGQFDAYTHFTPVTDELVAQGVAVTLSVWIDQQLGRHVIAALGNPYQAAGWPVGSDSFVTAAGTGGMVLNGAGQSVPVPQNSHDPTHMRVHVEFLYYSSVPGVADLGWRHEECFFPWEAQVLRPGDPASLTVAYRCHGQMEMITAFTAGTDITPAIT